MEMYPEVYMEFKYRKDSVSLAVYKKYPDRFEEYKNDPVGFLAQLYPDTVFTVDTSSILTISSKVGDLIDSTEKAKYHLFPYWKAEDFLSAQFIVEPDGKIFIVGQMKDGSIKKMAYSRSSYEQLARMAFDEKIVIPGSKLKNKQNATKTLIVVGSVVFTVLILLGTIAFFILIAFFAGLL